MKFTVEVNNLKEATALINALGRIPEEQTEGRRLLTPGTKGVDIPSEIKTESTSVLRNNNPAPIVADRESPEYPETDEPALDSAGLPWDERIHSSNKKTIKDGTWQKRRGVDAELVAQVEAELKGEPVESKEPVAPAPAPIVEDTPPPAPAAPAAPPVAPPAPAAPAAPTPSQAPSFGELVTRITAMITTNAELGAPIVEIISRHTGDTDVASLDGTTDVVRTAVATELDGLV